MTLENKAIFRVYLNDLEEELKNSNSLENACEILQKLLDGPFTATESGELYEIKALVAVVGSVKLSINSPEHAPPHFHVTYGGEDGLFAIADCHLMKGHLSPRTRNIVYGWWKPNKALLIDAWNTSRPSDCPVGMYKE